MIESDNLRHTKHSVDLIQVQIKILTAGAGGGVVVFPLSRLRFRVVSGVGTDGLNSGLYAGFFSELAATFPLSGSVFLFELLGEESVCCWSCFL